MPKMESPKASIPISCTSMWSVDLSHGSTWSSILSLRSQWCPHSLANKWPQSGHPHNGVPPPAGSERGTGEQLAPRGAADQGRPLPLCRWGQHRKWHVWGPPPPHYWRYLDLMLLLRVDQSMSCFWVFLSPKSELVITVMHVEWW